MTVREKNVGIALTGSFCTYDRVFSEIEKLIQEGANVYPIFSTNSQSINSRFGNAMDHIKRLKELAGRDPVTTIEEAEKLGPNQVLDIILVAPCTGNTLAKLAYGITDTPVLMASKGHLRNAKPVVLAIASNDALAANMKNIGTLLNTKHFYFVPFGQDNYEAKPYSMVANFELVLPTIQAALEGRQLQPITQNPK